MKLSKEQSTELFDISSDLNIWLIQMLKMAKGKKHKGFSIIDKDPIDS